MKKNLLIIILALVIILAFVSCDNSKDMKSKTSSSISNTTSKEVESMLDKLHQIKKGWTSEQVRELLGNPDEAGGSGIYREIYYLNAKETATIMYSDGVWSITIRNTETSETTTIL